jgi:N-acyl-L-homoserine lactone synthetase
LFLERVIPAQSQTAELVRFRVEYPLDMSREDSDIQDVYKSLKTMNGVVKSVRRCKAVDIVTVYCVVLKDLDSVPFFGTNNWGKSLQSFVNSNKFSLVAGSL